MILIALATGWRTRGEIMLYVQQASLLHTQRRLANTTLGPEIVTYSEDPQLMQKLLSQRGYARMNYGYSYKTPPQVPQDWPRGVSLQTTETLPTVTGDQSLGTHFLGKRETPSGEGRIIGLGMALYAISKDYRVVVITQTTVSVMGWRPPGSLGKATSFGGRALVLSPTDQLTLFAGQRDPNDLTHFTIDYILNGAPGTIDARLQDDGFVEMTVRNGPAQLAPAQW